MRLPALASSPYSRSEKLGERCRARLWKRLLSLVVDAVNQRGMCAAELATMAELPATEIESLRGRCSCPACFVRRAN